MTRYAQPPHLRCSSNYVRGLVLLRLPSTHSSTTIIIYSALFLADKTHLLLAHEASQMKTTNTNHMQRREVIEYAHLSRKRHYLDTNASEHTPQQKRTLPALKATTQQRPTPTPNMVHTYSPHDGKSLLPTRPQTSKTIRACSFNHAHSPPTHA